MLVAFLQYCTDEVTPLYALIHPIKKAVRIFLMELLFLFEKVKLIYPCNKCASHVISMHLFLPFSTKRGWGFIFFSLSLPFKIQDPLKNHDKYALN